jgi:hypothetical protein
MRKGDTIFYKYVNLSRSRFSKNTGDGGVSVLDLKGKEGRVFGVETLSMSMKNGMTQNQQMTFVVKCKIVFVIFLFRITVRRRGRFAHPTPFSAFNRILCVTVVCKL